MMDEMGDGVVGEMEDEMDGETRDDEVVADEIITRLDVDILTVIIYFN